MYTMYTLYDWLLYDNSKIKQKLLFSGNKYYSIFILWMHTF